MDLKIFYDTVPPWDWPKDAGKMFEEILESRTAHLPDRLLAAQMAGNVVVFICDSARPITGGEAMF